MKPKTQISTKLVILYNTQFSKFIRKIGNRNSSVTTPSIYTQCILLLSSDFIIHFAWLIFPVVPLLLCIIVPLDWICFAENSSAATTVRLLMVGKTTQ